MLYNSKDELYRVRWTARVPGVYGRRESSAEVAETGEVNSRLIDNKDVAEGD